MSLRESVREIVSLLCPVLHTSSDYKPNALEKEAISRVNEVVDLRTAEILQAIEEAIAPPGKLVPYTRKQDTFAHGYNAALAEIKEILRS